MSEGERRAAYGLKRWWLATFGVLCLFAVVAELQFERVSRRQVERGLHTVLDMTRLALESWSRFEKANVEGWAADDNVGWAAVALAGQQGSALARHPLQTVLRRELQVVVSSRGYLGYRLLGIDGRVLAAPVDEPLGGPMEAALEPGYFERLRTRGPALAEPAYRTLRDSGEVVPAVYVGAPVFHNGELAGYLLFGVDLRRDYLPFLLQARVGDSGETFGVDRHGTMVGVSRYERQLQETGRLPAGGSSMLRLRLTVPGSETLTVAAAGATSRQPGIEAAGYRDYRGVDVVAAWGWSDELGLGVIAKIDASEAYGHIVWLRAGLALLCLICGALIAVSLRIARHDAMLAGDLRTLEDVLESCPLGSAVTDVGGRVGFVNGGMVEVIGASRETLLATPSSHWYRNPDDRAAIVAELTAGRAVRNVDLDLKRGDGGIFQARVSLMPLRGPGGRFVVWVEDVTASKRAAAELAVAGDMAERASRMKSEFLANVSHEIRTPINAVLNLTRLALDGDGIGDKQRGYLEKSLTAAETLLALINDVLDLSKIEAGRMELERQAFQLPRVFAQVTGMLGERAQAKQLALAVAVAPDIPRTLVGDPVRLTQVLVNLLSNAIKFTDSGSIEFRVDCIGSGDGKVNLRFCVRDSGIGIAPDTLQRLFEPFVQADASISRQYGGSGLGLAICNRLVALMGGAIEVDSQPGAGSTFSFTIALEVVGSAASEVVEGVVDTGGLHGRRILVAEDNPLNREVIREYLERVGVRVVCVEDGQAAVDRVLGAEVPFDAVLMDVQMPNLDGIAATRLLRAESLAAGLPIIAVTANALVDEMRRCREAGMNDCVTKPYRPETIYRVLIEHLAAGTASSPPSGGTAIESSSGEFDAGCLLAITARPEGRRLLAQVFCDSIAEAERDLPAMLAARDVAALAALTHRLKSSALTVGAQALGATLVEINRLVVVDDAAAFETAQKLPGLLAAARQWMRQREDFDKGGT